MYRRCIFCGWGRKECLEHIKFFCVPKEGTLQRLQWMNTCAEKRNNGFKKVDSVCSIHFVHGKPNSDPSHVDFAPSLHLNTQDIPEELRTKSLRHYSQESDEVHEEREKRLRAIKNRMEIMKRHLREPEDAWKKRKAQRKMMREQQGEEVPERYYTELDPAQIPPPLFPMNTDENEEEDDIEIELVHRAPKSRRYIVPRRTRIMGEHPQEEQLTAEYDIADYHDSQYEMYQGVVGIEEVIAEDEEIEIEKEPIEEDMHNHLEPVYQYEQQARVVCVAPHRAVTLQPTAYIRAQDPPSFVSRPGPSSRHVYINNSHLDPIDH